MDYLEKLKVLMKQHNLTEYKLAQKADVAQSTIKSLMKKHELEEQNLLKKWGLLTNEQKKPILQLIDLLLNNGSKN